MSPKKFEAVIIGSGLGGLICGNYLAKAGIKTAILEQHIVPGGYCTSFKRGQFLFDSAIHFLSGFEDGGLFTEIFEDIGMNSKIEMLRLDPIYRVDFGFDSYTIPADFDQYFDMLVEKFPNEKNNISDFFKLVRDLFSETKVILKLDKEKRSFSIGNFPLTMKYLNMTFAQMISEFIKDEKLISVMCAGWPYIGLPPSKVSALKMAGYLYIAHFGGFYYPKGGIQHLANVLVDNFENNGGKLLVNSEVTGILIDNGTAYGVETKDGRIINAKYIISNADIRHTVFDLIGSQYLNKKFLNRLNSMRSSVSFFQVWAGVNDADLRSKVDVHDIFCYPSYNLDDVFEDIFKDVKCCGICIPTITDVRSDIDNMHVVSIKIPCQYEDFDEKGEYEAYKKDMEGKLIRLAEKIIPGLSEKIVVTENASPKTFYQYTKNFKGAAYGWEPVSEILNKNFSSIPISNIYLAGHWAFHAGSTLNVALSGRLAANTIIEEVGSNEKASG